MLSGNSLRLTVHTHCASVYQAAKLVAAILRIVGVTAGLAESNGSLPPGLWLTSPAGWLLRTRISSRILRLVIDYGLPLPFTTVQLHHNPIKSSSSMHHNECVALCNDISLQRGRFCARSLASCIPRSSKDRSSWMFFIQAVCSHPGGRLQFSGGRFQRRVG